MTVATRSKNTRSAKIQPMNTPEQFCDAVYWQMFHVESGRSGAEICLASTLLRAWLALEHLPAESEPRQWLRNVTPVCMQMLDSLRIQQADDESISCTEDHGNKA